MRRMCFLIAAFAILLPTILAAQWTVTLTRPDDPIPRAFGVHPSATDSFDSYDLQAPPPGMVFTWHFLIEDDLITEVRQDIRPVRDTIQWLLVAIWPADDDSFYQFSWDPVSLPTMHGNVFFDTLADMSTATDMSGTDTYVFNHPPPGIYRDSLYIQFVTTPADTDTFPPYAINWYPGCGIEDVSIDLDSVSVDILDAHNGIDESSIVVTVSGMDITMFVNKTAIENGFHLYYHLPMTLPYDTDIPIEVTACDTVGNCTLLSCVFHTAETTIVGQTLSGYVYDASSLNPIEGAIIIDATLTYSGTANSEGYYEIDDIPDESYTFSAVADGYGAVFEDIAIAGADVVQDFYLPVVDTFDLSGTVTDDSTGLAIEGAVVSATWGSGSLNDTTDVAGAYAIADIPGGVAVIVAEAASYLPDTAIGSFSVDTTINFALTPIAVYYRVYGLVTLEDETDHSGTVVTFGGIEDTTDATGAFEFLDVPAGDYDFSAEHTGFVTFDSLVSVSADVEINVELVIEPTDLAPARNVTPTYDDYAGFIFISWEAPLEEGLEEIKYDDGDLSLLYLMLDTEMITQFGVAYNTPEPVTLMRIDIQYNAEEVLNCNILEWDGAAPGATIGGVTAGEEWSTDYFYSCDFSGEGIILDGDFFVEFDATADTLYPFLDEIATADYDELTLINAPDYGGWLLLTAAGDFSAHVWVIRVYVETEGGRVMMLTPDGLEPVVEEIDYKPVMQRTYPGIEDRSGLARITETTDIIYYRLYRADFEFTDTTEAGVEMIYTSTGPDDRSYLDMDIDAETDYYYGVVAVYDEGDAPLSELGIGRRLAYRPAADVLIIDWELSDSLAEGGTADEVELLVEKLEELVLDDIDIYVSEPFEILEHFMLSINYDWIFFVTGQYPNIHNLIPAWDTTQISAYLAMGKYIFVEGNDFAWKLSEGDELDVLLNQLGVNYLADGYDTTGNVRFLTSVDLDFFDVAEAFMVDYDYQGVADLYVDEVSPVMGADAIMESQDADPAPMVDPTRMVFYDTGSYKSFYSTVYLGGMVDCTDRDEVYKGIFRGLDFTVDAIGSKPTKPNMPKLIGNTPNPFNATTAIRFELPAGDNVKLDILDATGHVIAVPANGNFDVGTHEIIWDAKDAASGVYTYRLTTSNGIFSGKMTLVK